MQQKPLSFIEADQRQEQLVQLHLPADTKLLLIVINTLSGNDGFCCPPLSDLARILCRSESTIRKAIAQAEQFGLLETTKAPPLTTDYRINWEAVSNFEGVDINVNRYL